MLNRRNAVCVSVEVKESIYHQVTSCYFKYTKENNQRGPCAEDFHLIYSTVIQSFSRHARCYVSHTRQNETFFCQKLPKP